ncbi:beta-galactosidase [Paenibacillus sp.]|uniref:beta-galactosidase n=1 Tax=Paenibacillus sp. TaxID=58172 RepID=UPI002810A061|nr:beta-galactosidase [Paenibacillus sp.]
MVAAGKKVVFYDETFPYDGTRPDEAQRSGIGAWGLIVDAEGIAEALATADSFVTLHGPYFPKAVWPELLAYLERGGGLVLLGGAPFRIPVYREDGAWKTEREQTAYHRQLLIHEALRVDGSRAASLRANEDIPLLSGRESLFDVADTYGFILHVTRQSDNPHEHGSAGPMDARIYPLLTGVSADGRETAAPAVLMEHAKGAYAGGRWAFVSQPIGERFWTQGGAAALADWADFVSKGVTELWLKPGYGSYEPGERASFALQAQTVGRAAPRTWTFRCEASLERNGQVVPAWEREWTLPVDGGLRFERFATPDLVEPGRYSVVCVATADDGERRVLRQGYWGMDRALLEAGEPLAVGRDYFVKNGKPLPIVGMTYMTSDVARKFLFLPNVEAWDRDMAQMKKAGINLIRTGVWTAWRQMMFADGHFSEEVLRAIDAFVLTAKKHELEVTFNFFSFTPETWEGANPYLDPRSVEAQKRFILSVVSRHRTTTNVQWDLINEPSMFDPKRVFSGPASARDRFEQAAYVEWLKRRHGSIRLLQERWNMTPAELPSFEAARPPERDDINFHVQDVGRAKKGLVWLDYALFTMEMHNRWARELVGAIKAAAPHQLVTVGQDEGLAGGRPSPFFYAEAVDYTTVHTWWMMDALVWDGLFTKDGLKPNLVQETGIMYVEAANGFAKRSEEELRNILERKYAYAFATGGAGAVQWIWNTNYFMDNVNESNIGALRADGTEKPEADVSYDFGAFVGKTGERFEGRALEEIAVVYPYSNDFSNRKFSYDATTRLTRVLAYEMKTPFRGVSEYHLDRTEGERPKLWIVPSAHNFSDEALAALAEDVRANGGTVLLTGPIGLDAYWGPTGRFADVVGPTVVENVLREERLTIDGRSYPASFGGAGIASLAKERPESEGELALRSYPLGKGTLLWCPLPIELNERSDVLRAVYAKAMQEAGVAAELEWEAGGDAPGVYGRKLTFRDGALFVFVSESGADADIRVKDPATGRRYAFALERERSVLFFVGRDGEVEAAYRPHQVRIDVE